MPIDIKLIALYINFHIERSCYCNINTLELSSIIFIFKQKTILIPVLNRYDDVLFCLFSIRNTNLRIKHLLLVIGFMGWLCVLGCQMSPQGYQVSSSRNIEHWYLRGQVYLITPTQRQSSTLIWQKTATQEDVTLLSGLGTTILQLTQLPQKATLAINGKTYHSQHAEQLLYQFTQWRMPLEHMHLWLKGHPNLPESNIIRDTNGRIISFKTHIAQKQWQVSYPKWHIQHGANMPKIIVIQQGKMRLKFNIKEWVPL
jgi:outer membrane lipoprotein LolB